MTARGPIEAPQPGDIVGGYRLETALGEGAAGQVFRAVRPDDGAVVAVKVLRAALAGNEEARRRFLREARAAGEVRHRNVVAVHEAGEAEGRLYLVMEHIAGGSLSDRIAARGPLEIGELAAVIGHVGAGLDALHADGLVHRDVKTSNVLLDSGGRAVVSDLGLAKGRGYSKITVAGQMVGTLHYLAPEILRGDDPGAPADVYALGCVAFECLAGGPPFDGSMFEVGMGHLGEPPPDPCAGREGMPAGLRDAVLAALAKDPAARPASAGAYAAAISRASAACA